MYYSTMKVVKFVYYKDKNEAIRRAAKKVTFIANMRTDMRVCECVCILPIYIRFTQ